MSSPLTASGGSISPCYRPCEARDILSLRPPRRTLRALPEWRIRLEPCRHTAEAARRPLGYALGAGRTGQRRGCLDRNLWLAGIQWARSFAFGTGTPDSSRPALYLFGQIGGTIPAGDIEKTWTHGKRLCRTTLPRRDHDDLALHGFDAGDTSRDPCSQRSLCGGRNAAFQNDRAVFGAGGDEAGRE